MAESSTSPAADPRTGSGVPLAALRGHVERAGAGEPIARTAAVAAAERLAEDPAAILPALLEAARALALRGHGSQITFSRNVFIPLTNLCRNRCSYCTFAVDPRSPQAHTYRLDEVRSTAARARDAGCKEALFCLGDKPELAYRGYRSWLRAGGYASTAGYLVDACAVAFEEGLFPHSNAGVLEEHELRALRPVNASMGLMLESTSERLRERGQAHYYAPDKEPGKRIETTARAGALAIPFTSGLLLGIGETPQERVETLYAIRDLQERHGHIQEVIVQNFHPKSDTAMADRPSPSDELMAGMVALARLVLGPRMNIQAPPNLSPTSLELLAGSGLNDWGGVSPVTIDFINPEAPWPELEDLRARTEAAGYALRERLAVYPEFVRARSELFAPPMLEQLRMHTDADGYPRA
jgi:7,8-didemethyl-8-hydroxy-5-deazariboflavin synthase CofG subunit